MQSPCESSNNGPKKPQLTSKEPVINSAKPNIKKKSRLKGDSLVDISVGKEGNYRKNKSGSINAKDL